MVDRFVIIDGSSYFYRAFWAVPRLTTSKGVPTNAVKGFTNMLKKVMGRFENDSIAVVFDAAKKTFRSDLYPEYKAHRPPMPDELARQIPTIKEIPRAYRLPTLEMEGFEADDIIGTLAKKAAKNGLEVCVVTADKDLTQLVTKPSSDEATPGVVLYDDKEDRRIGVDEVVEKFGVPPERIVDILALMGDATDNIPGVTGIGEKTAADLVRKYGAVEDLFANLERVEREKLRLTLTAERDNAMLSKKLACLVTDLPIEFTIDAFKRQPPDRDRLLALFKELEFTSEARDLEGGHVVPIPPARLVTSEAELNRFVAGVKDTLTFKMLADAGIALFAGEAVYVPIGHRDLDAGPQVPNAPALLKSILEDPAVRKASYDVKSDSATLMRRGVDLKGVAMDVLLGSYLLNPDQMSHDLDRIAVDHAGMHIRGEDDVLGKGKKRLAFHDLPPAMVGSYACESVTAIARAWPAIDAKLGPLKKVLDEIESPLVPVLRDMEAAGVKIDTNLLGTLSARFNEKMKILEKEAHDLAGSEFNVNSPQQLAEVLFDRLKLRVIRKTETGRSTDAAVLEELMSDHPLPGKILEYRGLAKLKGTYIDALPQLVNPKTGRVHTSFNQAVAATGRLSSSDPNLQNIPVRGDEGKLIRSAFIAEPGFQLVVADYSQIELRILAHLSKDETLIRAYREDRDIHALTAAEVFEVPLDAVTSDMRRRAKAVNFGIIYGMSAFGLANQLGIPGPEAKRYIERYFARYRGVRRFIDELLAKARQTGYVETMFGRRRAVVGIDSRNGTVRGQAERMATNTPIQGTAADLIKIAMIRLHPEFAGKSSRLIMQVHDELVVEAPDDEAGAVGRLLKEAMESVAELVVPLKVDVHAGRNWAEAKG